MAKHWEDWVIPGTGHYMFQGDISTINADKHLFPRSREDNRARALEIYVEGPRAVVIRMTTGEEVANAPFYKTVEEFIAWCRMVDAMDAGGG